MSQKSAKDVYHVVTLPGDGIGPEVLDEAVKVLARAAEKVGRLFEFDEIECGGQVLVGTPAGRL